jgi:hypothetical protein
MLLPFQIELTRLTLGFAQAPPPTLVKCKTYQATKLCRGCCGCTYSFLQEKKQTSCLKGGYKLSYVFLLLSHNATSIHTHKSLLLCNSSLTPIRILYIHIYSSTFLIHEVIKFFLNKCAIFFFFFCFFFPLTFSCCCSQCQKF